MATTKPTTDELSANDIARMVTSGGSSRACAGAYAELANLINSGIIHLEEIAYERTPQPVERNQKFWMAFGNHGEEHGWLKWWALNHISLAVAAGVYVRYEQHVPHGKADVASDDLRVVVECGDTNPEYIVTSLRSGHVERFYVFPFGDGQQPAYLFTASDDGVRFMQNEHDERLRGWHRRNL